MNLTMFFLDISDKSVTVVNKLPENTKSLITVSKVVFIPGNTQDIEVNIENDKMTVVSERKIDLLDMAMRNNGDILISSWDTTRRLYTKRNIQIIQRFLTIKKGGTYI